MDLVLAGTDTTATLLKWTLLYLIKYPEVQEKCFQEIKNVIGSDRCPVMSDKAETPYCQAVIEEIMRLCPEMDFNVSRYTLEDAQALGYNFPKGTQVYAFHGGIHKSEKYFENPFEFKPKRHIYDGVFKNHKNLNFFSFGKRRCIGEALAREEIYVVFTNMVQKFQFKKVPNEEIEFTATFRITLEPKQSYKMLVSKRQ